MSVRRKPSETPVHQLLESEWRRFETQVESVAVDESDLIGFVLWVIDGWRDDAIDARHYADQWVNLHHELRGHFKRRGCQILKGDLGMLTDIVMAFALHCLGKAIMGNATLAMVYMSALSGLGEHRSDVLHCMGKIETGSDDDGLREWMREVMESEAEFDVEDFKPSMRDEHGVNYFIDTMHVGTINGNGETVIRDSNVERYIENVKFTAKKG